MKTILLTTAVVAAMALAAPSAEASNFQLYIGAGPAPARNFNRFPNTINRGWNQPNFGYVNPGLHGNPTFLNSGWNSGIHQHYVPGRWVNQGCHRVWVPGQVIVHPGYGW